MIDDQALSPDDPPEPREEALYRAYASVYHLEAGWQPDESRAGEHLISRTAVLIGSAELAICHAMRYLELIATHPATGTMLSPNEAMARALGMAGDRDRARLSVSRPKG